MGWLTTKNQGRHTHASGLGWNVCVHTSALFPDLCHPPVVGCLQSAKMEAVKRCGMFYPLIAEMLANFVRYRVLIQGKNCREGAKAES